MSKRIENLKDKVLRLHQIHNDNKIESYGMVANEINKIKLDWLENEELKKMSLALMERAREGESEAELLVEAFALVKESIVRVMGICPYDVQLLGAIGMSEGKVIEMQTGEGKTLAAVFCAYLNALSGKGAHVLTFNDYLVKRDAEWMRPVYEFLGLTVGYIREGMRTEERKKAYNADITYVTAKEAGFDYLRSFLCYSREELVQRPFNFAIIDEADSILIDEARVPLVLAGSLPAEVNDYEQLAEIAADLTAGKEFNTDEYCRNVHLTDAGIDKVEKQLGCGNLFTEENINLLCALNSALHAKVLLKKDIDYVVRNGKVELVDEFTGRIADKRHWPDGLQAAVEAKEGLRKEFAGRIMGSLTLQNFLTKYPRICGMTATARPSAEELLEFYGVDIVTIPTNRKCIRIDYPDIIFTHKASKYRAIVEETVKVHSAGRPILIGTASIEESELLAGMLKEAGIECSVLNARNDELEAGIISCAGQYGAVTVSTNMAGRGTDIRLGGDDEQDRERVSGLGGLYVIGTNRHESLRIDNQLRGRAGRQGDPGSSRFFISLEDDLAVRFGIKNALPEEYKNLKQGEPIDRPVVRQRIGHIQRVVEGQNFEIRRTLRKYAYIIEEQRTIIHKWRQSILMDLGKPVLLSEKAAQKYSYVCSIAGEETMKAIEKRVTLFCIDKCWSDYLDYTNYLREGIHLVTLAGKNPLDEFARQVHDTFRGLKARIESEIVKTFNNISISKEGVDFEKEGITGPTSTWTYLVSDDYFKNNPGLYMVSSGNLGFAAMATAASWPLMLLTLLFGKLGGENPSKGLCRLIRKRNK